MCKLAQYRQCELLQRTALTNYILQQRNDIRQGCLFLSAFVVTAEIVHGIQDLVRYLTVVGLVLGVPKQFDEGIDSVGVLQCFVGRGEHAKVFDKFKHGDLMNGGHLWEVFEDTCGWLAGLSSYR